MDKQTTFDLFEIDLESGLNSGEDINIDLDTNELEEIDQTLEIAQFKTNEFDDLTFDEEFNTVKLNEMVIDAQKDNINIQPTVDMTTQEVENVFTEMLVVEDEMGIITDDITFQTLDTMQFNNEMGDLKIVSEYEEPEIVMTGESLVSLESDEDELFGKANILIIGVGGCGCNAIDRMYAITGNEIELVAIDTEETVLANTRANKKILIGENIFKGSGSGGDFAKVVAAFEEDSNKIRDVLTNIDMLFIAGGIGKGTGSVGLIEVTKVAKEMGILTIGFPTLPRRQECNLEVVERYYKEFIELVDSSVIMENERIASLFSELPLPKIAEKTDSLLIDGIRGIYELITKPGKINLDYADIKTVFKNRGMSTMAIGYGTGDNNVVDALSSALDSKVLELEMLKTAKTAILSITAGPRTITVEQAEKGAAMIDRFMDSSIFEQLFFGYSYGESYGDEVKVTFIATGSEPKELNFDYRHLRTKRSRQKDLQMDDLNSKVEFQEQVTLSNEENIKEVDKKSEEKTENKRPDFFI